MTVKRLSPWRSGPMLLVMLAVAMAACTPAAPPAEKAAPAAPAKPTSAPPAQAEKPAAKEAAPAAKDAQPAAKPAAGSSLDAEIQKLLDAAKAEGGSLSVVTHPANQYSGWVKVFQARFPDIKMEHLGMRPSEVTPRLLSEQKNGVFNYDVYVAPTSNTVKSLSPAGVFQDITPFVVIPELKDESKWHGGFNQYAEKDQKFSLITSMTVNRSTMINRALVPATAVSTIDDLLKPEWKGKISIYDPRNAAAGSLSLANVLRERGEATVRQIMENSVFVDSSPQVLDFAASGRYPIGIGADVDTLLKMQAEGAAKDIEVSDLTAFHAGAGIAVFTNAPHPAASRLLVNWFLTQEGQDAYAREGGTASRRVDVSSYTGNTPAYAAADWTNLDKYVRPNEWSGIPFVEKVNEIAKEIKR